MRGRIDLGRGDRMKRIREAGLALALCAGFAALLLLPEETAAAVTEGLRLCVSVLIPALFPFFICVNLAAKLGLTARLARLLAPALGQLLHISGAGGSALLLGALGGYPSGAQCVAALRSSGQLSSQEAEYLLLFCNNAGPAYLFGVVGGVLCGSPALAVLLWAFHLLSALAVGLLHRPKAGSCTAELPPLPQPETGAFLASVREAGQTLFQITALVTAFSVLSRLLTLAASALLPSAACALLIGMLELSGGMNALCALALPLRWKLTMASFLLGFGGLCVRMQTRAVLAPAGLTGRGMLAAKLTQGLIAAALTFLACTLRPVEAVQTASTSLLSAYLYSQAAVCTGFCLCCRKIRLEIPARILYNSRKQTREG